MKLSGLKSAKAVLHVARADFLERIRGRGFMFTVCFAAYIAYAVGSGLISMRVGDVRGVYTSAWVGTMVALAGGWFISLVGFGTLRNAVLRDETTGAGQILAATPISKLSYALGKWLSNTAVLATQVLILAGCAVPILLIAGEDKPLHVWPLLSPFLLLALPFVTVTAAAALLFEMVPVLRGGLGTVLWIFLLPSGFAVPIATGWHWLDPSGTLAVMDSLIPAARAALGAGYANKFSIHLNLRPIQVAHSLQWQGISWHWSGILLRFSSLVIAIAIVALAAALFNRFDTFTVRRLLKTPLDIPGAAAVSSVLTNGASRRKKVFRLIPLDRTVAHPNLLQMWIAELRLATKHQPWWWYAGALGLVAGQLASPLAISRGPLLAVAWLWPLVIWSAMGVREARFGTGPVVFSSARTMPLQFTGCWLAGISIAAICGFGSLVRFLIAGDVPGILAWSSAVLFIPALALTLGVWTASSRAFEGVFAAWWYVGPLNRIPGFDFTGNANGTHTASYAALYFALALTLIILAVPGRRLQIAH